ncbi:hypothetical protein HA466_0017940 [Hirschfeldia incana]|nr:hypothetical protein HA466_0017940 [Hirschfeldia incana]KAJ0265523.1 hypothetical protein HA466_0017940 [Hirschfeldia incana]
MVLSFGLLSLNLEANKKKQIMVVKRLPEDRQTSVVSEAGSGSEKGEEDAETAVAVAVNDESESNLVREPPPGSSSARAPFSNLSIINSNFAVARTLQEQVSRRS